MESFFKAFVDSKIPSLLVLLLFFFFGSYLLIDSKQNSVVLTSGAILLLIGCVLGTLAFESFKRKEYIDSVISHFKNALDTISKTHSSFEQNTQQSLENSQHVGKDEQAYSVSREKGTTAT